MAAQRQASQSAALLKSAIGRLRELPESVDVDLQPPSVVLDARSSRNGEEILATIGLTPGEQGGGLNLLTVRSENVNFMRGDVRDGDLVRCYLLPDRESRNRLRETGDLSGAVVTFDAIELPVAQVLGPNSLRLSKDLRIPLRVAKDLFADLDRTAMALLEDQGAINADGLSLRPEVLEQVGLIAWPFKLEVWRINDDRMREVSVQLAKYASQGEPAFGWEPTADRLELEQLLQRINQW
ncbi:MAG: hypothetical protein AAF596_10375, partial [Planctomycetota bacterium]